MPFRVLLLIPLLAIAQQSQPSRFAAAASACAGATERGQLSRDLARLYDANHGAPLWTSCDGTPTVAAGRALRILLHAADDGLDPDSYRADEWLRQADALRSGAAAPATAASFDVGLTASVIRFLHDLHAGRIDSRDSDFAGRASPHAHDYGEAVRGAVEADAIGSLPERWRPSLEQYEALRLALARYRRAAETITEPFNIDRVPIHPGDALGPADALARRLATIGDMSGIPPAAAAARRYDGELVEAIERFQQRHGLDPDGVIGRTTRDALAVPLKDRVRQIELALERLRWLPELDPERRLVAVNVPMFRLWAWDRPRRGARPVSTMRVIVGRARATQTPVFAAEMTHVVFRPYWNVPRSIVLKEMLPKLEQHPGYLSRENLDVVAGPRDDSPVLRVDPIDRDTIRKLRTGELRLRQRPGRSNALGLIKFVFPNDADVYMHATPTQSLFTRSRRDFSHGCVRVDDAPALAEWALGDADRWSRDRIVAAMNGADTRRVDLKDPVLVILFYTTAVVWPDDGTVHFSEDIYGLDGRLDRLLREAAGTRGE